MSFIKHNNNQDYMLKIFHNLEAKDLKTIITNRYGNYAIKELLNLNLPFIKDRILKNIFDNLLEYSRKKYPSYTVEAAFELMTEVNSIILTTIFNI